jgi:hypothetical protein
LQNLLILLWGGVLSSESRSGGRRWESEDLTLRKAYQDEKVERWFLHGKMVISESLPP